MEASAAKEDTETCLFIIPPDSRTVDKSSPEYCTEGNSSCRQIFETSGDIVYVQENMVAYNGMEVIFSGITCYQARMVAGPNGEETYHRDIGEGITEVFIPDKRTEEFPGLLSTVKYLSRDPMVGEIEHSPESVAQLRAPKPNLEGGETFVTLP